MAESFVLPERVQESLHCPVCFHCYNDPRNLPCQHTFCKLCIKKLVSKSALVCPLCNVEHLILATEPEDFPKNFALGNVIDCLCEECRQRQKSLNCNFCDKGICDVCNSAHDSEHSSDARKTLDVLQFQLTELERRNIRRKEESVRRADRVKAEIQAAFGACRQALDDRERKITDHLHSLVHQDVDSSSQKEFRQLLLSAKEFCTSASQTINEGVDISLGMSDLRDIKDQAREHSNLILPMAEINTGNPQRIFFAYNGQDVLKPLSSFGKLLTAPEEPDVCTPMSNKPLSIDYFPYLAPKYILGRYVKSTEEESDEFGRPWGVACSTSAGNTIITDVENNKAYAFADGELLFSFGGRGRGNDQFYHPRGVAISFDDNIYIADSYNNRIQVFDGKGKYWNTIGRKGSGNGQFSQPMGITFDGQCGLLYVCDSNNYRIQVLQEDGTFLRSFGSRGSGSHQFSNIPCHIAVSPTGKVFVSDRTECIHIFNQEGDFIDVVDIGKMTNIGACNLVGLCVDPAGNVVVVTEQGDVIVLWDDQVTAQYIRKVSEEGSTTVGCLKDIAFNNEGVMFVCDCETRTVKAFDTILHF